MSRLVSKISIWRLWQKSMIEKLIIRNFCGIKNIEIELADITVLIGPQATGKSVCAKSLYFFKRLIFELRIAVDEEKTKRDFDEGLKRRFEEYFPQQSWTPKFLLRYEVNHESGQSFFIQVKKSAKSALKLSYSNAFKTIFEKSIIEHKRIFSSKIADEGQMDYKLRFAFEDVFRDLLKSDLGEEARIQYFIPAGRSFFGILQSSIFSFLATNTAIDPFLKSFGSLYENVKSIESRGQLRRDIKRTKREERLVNIAKKVDLLATNILKGEFVSEKGKDYLISLDSRKTSLTNASSGQQETLPLVLILRYLQNRLSIGSRRGFGIYIEEPEAHIFPAAQKQIVQLISLIYNSSAVGTRAQFLITTHSPYILTAMNNLLLAGKLSSRLKGKNLEKLYNIVDQDMLLKIENIRCYSLQDGISRSMTLDETELIDSDVIDEVSDDLSIEFDKLVELE